MSQVTRLHHQFNHFPKRYGIHVIFYQVKKDQYIAVWFDLGNGNGISHAQATPFWDCFIFY